MASVSGFCSRNCNFQPTSALPKALSLIPIIGTIITFVEVTLIDYKLNQHEINAAPLTNREIKDLTQSKIHYQATSMGKGVMLVAAIAVLLGLSIINPILGGIWLGLNVLALGYAAYKLHQGIQQYNQLPD